MSKLIIIIEFKIIESSLSVLFRRIAREKDVHSLNEENVASISQYSKYRREKRKKKKKRERVMKQKRNEDQRSLRIKLVLCVKEKRDDDQLDFATVPSCLNSTQ